MQLVFLLLDFLFPLFFIALGICLKGKKRRILIKESVLVLGVAILFAPLSYFYASVPVQGVLCAGLIFLQFLLLARNFLFQK